MSIKTHSAKFAAALLVTTAFTAPAFAQIETVVVTAERKAEDIQTVPVSVTALTSADLKSKQVNSFRDLQFHVPSVTYTKSNFGGAQFQIRGITTQFGLGAAIAQNINDVYQESPNLVTGQYYDVDRVEVARGPQSTSYGRAATGGAVNVITSKPNLTDYQARASFDYGTYNTMKPEFMVNVPLIDNELAVRVAGLGVFHDGYEKNAYTGPQIFPGGPVDKNINGQGTASGRVSVRWEPSDDTTIDLVGEVGYENDNRVRGDKQECHRDPSGVLGCLPDALGTQPINNLSTLGTTLGSKQVSPPCSIFRWACLSRRRRRWAIRSAWFSSPAMAAPAIRPVRWRAAASSAPPCSRTLTPRPRRCLRRRSRPTPSR